MSQIQNIATAPRNDQAFGSGNSLNDLNLDSFLDLMIAELQNQDPLNPLENDQLLAQISQIREVGATDRLTDTLDAVLLGQNVSSATNLIGADVTALTEEGERITGNVRKVTIDNGQPKLDVAIDVTASAGDSQGEIEEGRYTYEVVWQGENGLESLELGLNAEALADFNGSITVNNLPNTGAAVKQVYRTDKSGEGERRLVVDGLPGATTSFTDITADANRSDLLTGERLRLQFARKETVTLNNIAEITPPK